MPPPDLSPEETAAALRAASAELSFLLDREGVGSIYQAHLYRTGITSINKLAAFASDITDLKSVLKSSLDLDPAVGMAERVQVAAFVCAFRAATARANRFAEAEGDMDARRLTKPLPLGDLAAMRAAWEKKWWRLEDHEVPAVSYLEKKLEELEKGEWRAEPLTAVCHFSEEEPDTMTPVFTATGTITLKRGTAKGEMPANSEQLRRRIQLLGTALMFIALRHSNRDEIQNLTPQVFHAYLSYLLGDYVWGLVARGSGGESLGSPSWNQILVYEHAIRRKAWRTATVEGMEFGEALKRAYEDPTTKERNFTTPVALSAAHRSLGPPAGKDTQRSRTPAGSGRGAKGKASGTKAKGHGRSTGKGSDGDVCFRYNEKEKKCSL